MNSILALRSEIKINLGRRGLAAAHVQGLWQVGENVPTDQSLLLSRQCGGCLETTLSNSFFFCMAKITGFSRFSKHKIEYPNTPSAAPYDDSMPGPRPLESYTFDSDS
jgi:hypothetical protein